MTLTVEDAQSRAKAIMPAMIDELKELVAHASVALPGYPAEPVNDARAAVIDLLKKSGVPAASIEELDLGDGAFPTVYATMEGPADAPTVLLYAHYDVTPAPTDGWNTDPWTATMGDDGRLYGRGVADDKSGVIIHAGALQVLEGKAPVNLIIVIEGEEETHSHLEAFVEANPDLFQADIYLIADMGPMVVGEPMLTTALRGDCSFLLTVTSLEHPNHSGLFGGGAPDAMMALSRILTSLLDDDGAIAVPGLHGYEWKGAQFDEKLFRDAAGLPAGVRMVGEGSGESLASRVWSRPFISAIGIDLPSVATSANIVLPSVRAQMSMRIAPGADGATEMQKVWDYIETQAPWGVKVEFETTKIGEPFSTDANGPAVTTARGAMSDAYGTEAGAIGTGGSIPLTQSFAKVNPTAEMVIYGAQDFESANIHSLNESVDPSEIENNIVAEALMLTRFA